MRTALDRKKKRFAHYFFGIPLAIVLIVANLVLISWLFHILITSFANDLDHMSLSSWAEHLYVLIKDLMDKILQA